MARYLWNASLSAALYPALHAVEITFRNHIFFHSVKIVGTDQLSFNEVHCWLDSDPSLLYEREAEEVENAKHVLRKGKKDMTPGRLISKLGFGFWCSLCRSPYEQGRASGPALWPALINKGFPFLPKDQKSRPHILQRFNEIREVRNRAFHHEPIWDRNMKNRHERILASVGWMNQGVADAVRRISTVDTVADKGVEGFREMAEALVRL